MMQRGVTWTGGICPALIDVNCTGPRLREKVCGLSLFRFAFV